MGVTGPGGWQGIANSPYLHHEQYAGDDFVAEMTFVNTAQEATKPTSIQYRVDSLASVQNIVAWTSVTPTSSQQELQIAGAVLQPTRPWYGRESFQIWIQAVIPDTTTPLGFITKNARIILDLIMISVPS